MPAKQRCRCGDEGPPACARQEPASRRQEQPVGPCHRRTAGSSSEDGEFVPNHDDFQLLELVRPETQGSKLQNSPKQQVTDREEHEASSVARQPPHSTRLAFGLAVSHCAHAASQELGLLNPSGRRAPAPSTPQCSGGARMPHLRSARGCRRDRAARRLRPGPGPFRKPHYPRPPLDRPNVRALPSCGVPRVGQILGQAVRRSG
jgi:hypothetical protein